MNIIYTFFVSDLFCRKSSWNSFCTLECEMDSTDGTVNDGISLESSVGVTENAGDASATLEPGQKIQQPEQVTETERTGNDPAPISSQRNGDATDGKSTINGDDLTVADNIQEKEQVLKNVEDGDNQIPKNVEQITKIVPGVTDQVSDVKEDKDQLLKTVQEDKDQVPLTVQKDEGQVPENVQVDKDQVPKIAQEDEGSEGEIGRFLYLLFHLYCVATVLIHLVTEDKV